MENAADCEVYPGSLGPDAPCICLIGMGQGPLDMARLTMGLACTVVGVPVHDWDNDLTPWPAPGLYPGDPDFQGNADAFYARLTNHVLPTAEKAHGLAPRSHALMGYSLAGLFSLYEFALHEELAAVAGVSPSVWYDGWPEFLARTPLRGAGRFAYLSIGAREKRASPARLHTVEERVLQTARVLEGRGVQVDCSVGPGNHFQHVQERMDAAVRALDGFLARGAGVTPQ